VNREILLNCIRKHLAADAREPSASRPLGEVVLAIAQELLGDTAIPVNGHTVGSHTVTAIPSVAAFVDGGLSLDEEQIICETVARDNSVLAEIVASMRAKDERPSIPALDDRLMDRLMGIAIPASGNSASDNSIALKEPVVPFVASKGDSVRASKRRGRRRNMRRILIVAAAVAAVWTVAFQSGWWSRIGRPDPAERSIAQPTEHPETPKRDNLSGYDHLPEPDSKETEPTVEQPMLAQQESDPETPDTESESGKAKDPDSKGDSIASMRPTKPVDDQPSMLAAASPGDLRWTKIQGVLARRLVSSSESIVSGYHRWSGTQAGTVIPRSDLDHNTLHLSTLPLSRAEGLWGSSGKLVLAPDSSVSLFRTDATPLCIRIDRGAIAMVDMPEGSEFEVLLEERSLAKLRWRTQGTIVVSISSTGMTARIDGTLESAGSIYKDSLLRLAENIQDRKAKSALPGWVNRNIETPMMPNRILAQLAASDDVAGALDRIAQDPTAGIEPAVLMQFAVWRDLSSGIELHQLFAEGDFAKRSLAIDQLLQRPAWTASHQRMWQALRVSSQNDEQIQILMELSERIRMQRPLIPLQVERLLQILENRDPATRSLADAMLRRNFGNGPNYNPIAPQANNPRAIAVWRRFIAAL